MMDSETKKVAMKQYLHYFRFWFIAAGIALALFIVGGVSQLLKTSAGRGNDAAPMERVYDKADVLTDAQEEKLRQLIAETEKKTACDIVLVTINQQVESASSGWETTMRNLADDFYDENNYGYDKVHGDGVLLLDNWYEGQAGSWLSTCGKVYQEFGTYEINRILDAVYYEVEEDPYEAYCTYVRMIGQEMSEEVEFPAELLLFPVIVMFVFVAIKLRSPLGKETVSVSEYVVGGRPVVRVRRDQLVNKVVTRRHIPRNNGGGGGRSGGSRSGGGGGHRSSGGVSHGGGGRRR
ncbi:MAG: TPM domain-containing protein [Lachnospiraceae bacterium]|nr:TPM domain-containing protein [Lachnospiraceae bacterium]